MRGNAEAHELIAPGSLPDVLELLAAAPGQWTPIAGGTELMVAHAAGRLSAGKLVSLWGIPDLRFIEATPQRCRRLVQAPRFPTCAATPRLRRSSRCWTKQPVGLAPSPTRLAQRLAATW